MRYGICLANIGTYADPRNALTIAEAADEAGWSGVFVWDHLAFTWGRPAADPWTVLSAIAARTEHVHIGTMVTPVARRRPQVLAQQVATLDLLSGGRVIFGAGLGGSKSEFAKFGDPADDRARAAALDEGLDVLRALWSGDEVRHHGARYVVDGVTLAPLPAQKKLPVWIGGNRRPSLQRAARWDGWCADSSDPTGMTLSPDDVRAGIAKIGRGGEFDVAVLGRSDRGDPGAYEEAGATWWLESIHDDRLDFAAAKTLVEAGPPA